MKLNVHITCPHFFVCIYIYIYTQNITLIRPFRFISIIFNKLHNGTPKTSATARQLITDLVSVSRKEKFEHAYILTMKLSMQITLLAMHLVPEISIHLIV